MSTADRSIDCKHELKSKLTTGLQTAAVYELLRKDVKEHGLKKERLGYLRNPRSLKEGTET